MKNDQKLELIIGLPKEVKVKENRVALKPSDVELLTGESHTVKVQKNAGLGAGYPDEEYEKAGATMVDSAKEAYDADIVIKVKEPIKKEYDLLKEGTILYTYLHLAADESTKELTEKLLEKKITGIAYETVEDENGALPLLKPMSVIAGHLAVHYGQYFLQAYRGGRGVLIGNVEGADPANVVVLGGGNVGYGAAAAIGANANVSILDINPEGVKKKEEFKKLLKSYKNMQVIQSSEEALKENIEQADLLIGGVLIPGAKAPKIVTEEMLKSMEKGAVIVDVAIDQGGCTAWSKPTTHENPTYEIEGKVLCCITNMPGSKARTATQALTHATTPYLFILAEKGLKEATELDSGFAKGINTYQGQITYKAVAESLDMMDKYKKLDELL